MIVVGSEHHTKKKAADNKLLIINWFKDNPGESMKECHRQTKISYLTVRKHVKAILAEQRKKNARDVRNAEEDRVNK